MPDEDDPKTASKTLRRSLDKFEAFRLYEQGGMEAVLAARRREMGAKPKLVYSKPDEEPLKR